MASRDRVKMTAARAPRWLEWVPSLMLIGTMACPTSAVGQAVPNRPAPTAVSSNESLNDSVRELRGQIRELQAAMADMRAEYQRSREESAEMRRELNETRAAVAASSNAVLENAVLTKSVVVNPPATEESTQYVEQSVAQQNAGPQEDQKKAERAASLEEEYQLLSGKVDDQYQTKVESASKYRLRLSGIVLMNLFGVHGSVDSIDLPTIAYAGSPIASGGSFGATVRQSEIGVETFGPTVAGARTRADLQLDLAGGFPSIPNGVNSGFVRLRTATMRMDWTNTSVIVGQDGIFFSPNSPTSFATLAIPALSYAGNLWSWVPQVRVEHRVTLGDNSTFTFQGGILDPVSGEIPAAALGPYRQPAAGEASRQPAYGARTAWSRNLLEQSVRIGAGGFYGRQDYGFDRNVDAWAAMADLEMPLTRQLSLTGELYRGRGLGGLYGGIGRSAVFSGDPLLASSEVRGLNTAGGWAQLKYRPAIKWEFNGAYGMDNPFASDLKYFPYAPLYGDPFARNRGSFVNMIYRPRSDLLFSGEYRYLTTYSLINGRNNAGQVNLMMGILF